MLMITQLGIFCVNYGVNRFSKWHMNSDIVGVLCGFCLVFLDVFIANLLEYLYVSAHSARWYIVVYFQHFGKSADTEEMNRFL